MKKNESERFRSALLGHYEMMKNAELCDFRIEVEGFVFTVHKMILASRSPYFRTLFSSNMAESNENLLKLDDIEIDIFRVLLNHMYTCELAPLSNEEALKLIMHGEKYGLKEVVDHCVAQLLEKIDIAVAARCFLVGYLLKRKELQVHALSTLRRNWEVAFSTDGWNDVVLNHSLMTVIEKIECGSARKLEILPRSIMVHTTKGEVKWHIPISSVDRRNSSSMESHAFSLIFEDDDLSWKLCTSYSERKGRYTVAISHVGPPVIIPVSCCFAVRIVQGRKEELCTGTIDTSCCFLQDSTCQTVLTTFPRCMLYSEEDFISVILKKSEKTSETSSSIDYLSEYLENSCFTDATIKVRGEEFPVHKIILSVASPIFLETFQNQGSIIELTDLMMDPETFRNLLLLIYRSQEIPNPVNFDLLKAAKWYKLSNKQINRCRAAIFLAMKDSHLIDFLIQANAQQDPIMKRMAFKQMAYNFDTVVQLAEWSQMSQHPDIHDEFFKFIVSTRNVHE